MYLKLGKYPSLYQIRHFNGFEIKQKYQVRYTYKKKVVRKK